MNIDTLSMVRRRVCVAAVLGVLAATVGADPTLGRHFRMTIDDGTRMIEEVYLPPGAVSPAKPHEAPREAVSREPNRLDPALRQRVARRPPTEYVEVLITFGDDAIELPAMPKSFADEPQDSALNRQYQSRREEIVASVAAQRRTVNATRAPRFAARYGVSVLETFWLADIWRARVPVAALDQLASDPAVRYVQSPESNEPPPDVLWGRQRMNSDWFADTPNVIYPFSAVRIALLDTGVYRSHLLFTNPSNIGIWRDCVNGTGGNCTTGAGLNPDDDFWGHGTLMGAVIVGSSAMGNDYRGVTRCTLDSYKVYNSAGLHTAATLRGFSAAVAEGAWVIVAEMQAQEPFTGAIATAAENAFTAGAIVVGANGNEGGGRILASPANAHRVIGVGSVNASTGGAVLSQLSGPTTDGRIKPDIQTPTQVNSAGTAGPSEIVGCVGTSCSTAFAGAAAALLSKWWCDGLQRCFGYPTPNPVPYAGPTYAAMIAYGSQSYPFPSTVGAGSLRLMGSYGYDLFGWIDIQHGQTADIPQNIYSRHDYVPRDYQVALWWPETPGQLHSRVHLKLIDPAGVERAASTSAMSVFQRVSRAGSIAYGQWKLRIEGNTIGNGTQRVFYWGRVRGGA
jgi:serine protease AprX